MTHKHNIVLFVALVWLSAAAVGCGGKSKPEQAAISADTAVTVALDTAAAADTAVTVAPDTANTFIDERDGRRYRTTRIGEQVWMAEDLHFAAEGSRCYGEGGQIELEWDEGVPTKTTTLSDKEIRDYCERYGRLYNWHTATKACPAGFHLPRGDEWIVLVEYAGGFEAAGKKLRSRTGWEDNRNGTDDYGFSTLPSGYDHSRDGGVSASYCCIGYQNYGWVADEVEHTPGHAFARDMFIGDGELSWISADKSRFLSVRCVMDDVKGGGK